MVYFQCYYDFFQCGIVCVFVQIVDGVFDLVCVCFDCGQIVCGCYVQIVVVMCGEDDFVGVWYVFQQYGDQCGVFVWGGIVYGVGNVDCGGVCFDGDFDYVVQIVMFGLGGVYW